MDLNFSITSLLRNREIFNESGINDRLNEKSRFDKYRQENPTQSSTQPVPNAITNSAGSCSQKDPVLRLLERKGIESLIKDVLIKNPNLIASAARLQASQHSTLDRKEPFSGSIEGDSQQNNQFSDEKGRNPDNGTRMTLRKFKEQLTGLKEAFKGIRLDIDKTLLREKIQFNSLIQKEIENKFKKHLLAATQEGLDNGSKDQDLKLQKKDSEREEPLPGEKTQKKVKKDVADKDSSEKDMAFKTASKSEKKGNKSAQVSEGKGLSNGGKKSKRGSENKTNGDSSSSKKRLEKAKKGSKKPNPKANILGNLMKIATKVEGKGSKRLLSEKAKQIKPANVSSELDMNKTVISFQDSKEEKITPIKKSEIPINQAETVKANEKAAVLEAQSDQSSSRFEILASPKSDSGY